MSPVGGIGINLAIQDAVAAARILSPVLRTTHAGDLPVSEGLLARVQRRRELPTRITQTFQTTIHGFLDRYLGRPGPLKAPLLLRCSAAAGFSIGPRPASSAWGFAPNTFVNHQYHREKRPDTWT
jgi:2-polyprenyl-6-methoxyphenol hydroxylase-like FAD-dependent oxidoreductase